jgi:hypothetical protein
VRSVRATQAVVARTPADRVPSRVRFALAAAKVGARGLRAARHGTHRF